MQFTLNVEKKTFVDSSGHAIEYNECTAVIGGVVIKFAPKPSDKKLFEHLLSHLNSK